MAARPSWRGQIRLALVSIPVEIYPATKAGKSIAFHQVHEPSGQRVRYEKVVPGIGPVDRDEILKGYEVEKGEYVLLDPEEIEKVKLESRKTLELTQFVDYADIDPIYYDKPYFVVPAGRPCRGSVRRAARGAEQDQEGRHRPAGDARAGICRQPEGVRARHGAGDAALRRRGATRRRAISATSATPSPTPTCSTWPSTLIEKKAGEFDAAEFQNRYIEALRRADRREEEEKGQARHPGQFARQAGQGHQRHRPDGGAQEEHRQRRAGPGARRRRPKKAPAKKARRRRSGPEVMARASSTSRPTTRSATSRRPPSPRARRAAQKATASSSRSMRRAGCTGISGSKWTGC